ncbi:hypothetical protein PUNSTDRAFT_146174 [Punctularia strigosozonata HHB-11173 SS5]|uniref:histidine kinase n=1 Tax=Punctularia strigosozonata (strain HHB-11173) TaxID=741275 RepID=R7S4V5_PUNST|nr:uncharacterized protein PUNSTDRAFT_146174 [Punctularia strigosozonata HHB-11173 SS5]EIN04852.1 hypothetical protein PUNSTDRAFT_146174 [Punctularia strigosozonata HHB-11173 SS5]
MSALPHGMYGLSWITRLSRTRSNTALSRMSEDNVDKQGRHLLGATDGLHPSLNVGTLYSIVTLSDPPTDEAPRTRPSPVAALPDPPVDGPGRPPRPPFHPSTPLSDFDETEFCRDYPSGHRQDGSAVIPLRQPSFADPYLFPLLARNELQRLTSLWYYTKFIQNDHDLLAQLQGAVDVVHDIMQQDCTSLGLMDHDDYTHIVTRNHPLSTVPRRDALCAHTIMQRSHTVFSLPNMLEDWRFAASPAVRAGMRSYVGAPLLYRPPGTTDVEIAFGALCVSSDAPKPAPSAVQTATLRRLAKTMVHMIVERAHVQRRHVQEAMVARLAAALQDLTPGDLVERRLNVLRECYPSGHVSYQIQQDGVVRLRGGSRVPHAQVRDSLWEATDATLKVVLDNHAPTDQAVRAIVVRVPSTDDAYLVVETHDLKTIFDAIDVLFVVQCAMSISNVVMSADLNAAAASKDQFLRGMTHDLRTPIHAIIATAELLKEGSSDVESTPGRETPRRMLDVIEGQGNNLLAMVNSLIRLNHLGVADQYDLSTSLQNLAAIEQSVVEGITGSAAYAEQRTDVAVVVDNQLPAAAELLLTNAATLGLVLGSLLGHALATTARGSIRLRTSLPADRAFLDFEVVDTGSGIVPADWGRVFPSVEPSADPDDGDPSHLRLSLATVARVATALNGTLALVSCTPGRGAHFRLRLHKPVIATDPDPESVRHRMKRATLPRTYHVLDGGGGAGTESVMSVARQLGRLGFAESPEEAATIVLGAANTEERPALGRLTSQWQTVVLVSESPEEEVEHHRRRLSDPRVLRCPSPVVRARLWAVVDAALHNYHRRGGPLSAESALHASRDSTPSAGGGDAPRRRDRAAIRLLIVDDNEINVKILVMYAKRRGYAHATARDGQEAVDRFADALDGRAGRPEGTFDLVLMDLQMPKMDGEEATRRIRALEKDAGTVPSLVYIVSAVYAPDLSLPDLILISVDHHRFYVHQSALATSNNAFDGLLVLPTRHTSDGADIPAVSVPDTAEILNIVLHGIYNLTFASPLPSFEAASSAAMPLLKYGFDIKHVFAPSTNLFKLFSTLYAHSVPMDVYCFAALYDLAPIASVASRHLLSFPFCTLDDALAKKMGPRYLRLLLRLHLGRKAALKRLLLPQPTMHPPNSVCGTAEQQTVYSAWALASADLARDACPSTTSQDIRSVVYPIAIGLGCAQCKLSFVDRSLRLIAEWAAVKMTIVTE